MPEQHQAFPTLQLTQAQGSTGQEMILQVKGCQHHCATGSCHFYIMRHSLVLSTQTISSEALMMSRLAGGQREKKRPQTVCCFWEVAYEPKENQRDASTSFWCIISAHLRCRWQFVQLSSANTQLCLKAKTLNRLPRDLVGAPCLETLKAKLDRL